jgi:hypothetical protein
MEPITTRSTLMQSSGSETSLPGDTSPQATLTSGALLTLSPTISEAIPNATSSQASLDGASPCDLPDGPITDLFGQDHAPASPSPQPEKAKHQAMNATSGPTGSSLSELADRQSSLANRLKRQLDGAGSTLFTLTWRKKATPLGRPYYQLAASGRRTSDSDCGSWASPNAMVPGGTPEQHLERKRKAIANGASMGLVVSCLDHQVQMASWQTPKVATGKYQYQNGDKTKPFLNLEGQAELASWPTPQTRDFRSGGEDRVSHPDRSNNLNDYVLMTGWPTAASRDGKGGYQGGRIRKGKEHKFATECLSEAAQLTPGPISSGSPAQTESKGQLNPAFSLWLMGYPPEWLSSAPPATRSRRKSRQSS